jgi:hypothetical protein
MGWDSLRAGMELGLAAASYLGQATVPDLVHSRSQAGDSQLEVSCLDQGCDDHLPRRFGRLAALACFGLSMVPSPTASIDRASLFVCELAVEPRGLRIAIGHGCLVPRIWDLQDRMQVVVFGLGRVAALEPRHSVQMADHSERRQAQAT